MGLVAAYSDIQQVARRALALPMVPLDKRRKEMFFNEALNTFYLQLYGIRQMVKDHSDNERKPAAATWATLSD